MVGRHFDEAAVSERECGPCSIFELYPGISHIVFKASVRTVQRTHSVSVTK
jgi:hypothetical protein